MEAQTTTSDTDVLRAREGGDLDEHAVLLFDGACGSNLQRMHIPPNAWGSCEGCNEYLNLTAPEVVVELHRSFLDAGANVIETNTFGANSVVLCEYGLEGQVEAINRAAVDCALKAAEGRQGVFVAGSCGPTTKLPSLGHISYDELADAYAEQIRPLVAGGVDLLIFETCQDLLQAKLAAITARRVFDELARRVPVMISITVETTGTMLTGADVAAAVATLEPLEVYSLGLNCATGPERMTSHIQYLGEHWHGRISMIPNAGMPQVVDGQTVYPLGPEQFAQHMREFILARGVSIVGGCCGTTPEHIGALRQALRDIRPAERSPGYRPSIASGYQAVEIRQDIPPLMIGERANANGSKKFRELLLADDWTGCLKVATDQEAAGAMAIDLCTAYAGRDELADMTALLRRVAESVKVPVVIDSTTPEVVEACLKLHPGRCVVNSINLEDGGENLRRIAALAARFGAACVALTINEKGMAMTADEKVATARAIHDLALQCGLRPQDLLFDPLTFTIGSGDETLRDAGVQTLEAIRRIKDELPGVHTVLGLSNISFGLPKAGRQVLNSVFLHEAVARGLDGAIVDSAKILPLSRIDDEERRLAEDLIHDRGGQGERTPLMVFIDHFQGRDAQATDDGQDDRQGPPEQQLTAKVVSGDKEGLDDLVHILLRRHRPTGVINDVLVPAMRHVGELFGRGEMLLPFVLQSAEVMKRSVDLLEPYMEKADDAHGTKILLATVQGDVHDIGKNLVDIILSNNGFTVYNIGTKVPAEMIIEKAREHDVDVIGLSGLLVKSAIVMKDSMAEYRRAGLGVPILLGGAALTAKFVARDCAPDYDQPVVYCADAFAGLRAMNEFEDGTLSATTYHEDDQADRRKPGLKTVEVDRENPVPAPPFLGARHVTDVPLEKILPFVNEQALFRGRWGYRRGKMSREDYDALIEEKVRPLYESLCRKGLAEGLLTPKVAYGYFRAHGEGDRVILEHEGRTWELGFPRQADAPHLCIADYFHPAEAGGDVAGLFVATVGDRVSEATRELFEGDEYHDYLMMHAFSVEVTDALAEYWHEAMRDELGIGARKPDSVTGYAVQDYQGSRYGFGYPACPDLDVHRIVFELLEPEAIGVTLTETMEMVPEQSTSALVAHHPQAKYFAV
jgi:5-methyltetrahydrofolate--homocysteine methyltransferase